MKEAIKLNRVDQEFYTPERCYITEISNSADDPELSIVLARVEPGITTRWHRLKGTTERYSIVSGSGVVEIGDLSPQVVSVGDTVLIPPMCRQRICNTGPEDLLFMAICTPRFSAEVYEDIEDK